MDGILFMSFFHCFFFYFAVNVVRMEPAPTQLPVKIITLKQSHSSKLLISRSIIGVILIVGVLNFMEILM